MKNRKEVSDNARMLFHSHGLKATLPRIKILVALQELPAQPLAADDIFQYMAAQQEQISFSCIYQTLRQLGKCGLVQEKTSPTGMALFTLVNRNVVQEPLLEEEMAN